MRNRFSLGTLVLLCTLTLVTPAGAVTVNGVDYEFLAKSGILMENSADCIPLPANTLGCMIVNGNIGVSDTTGTLKIGSNNIINGTATAHNIVFGSFSQTTDCEFDVSSGVAPVPPVCGSVGAPTLPIVAAWPPGPLGAVPVNNCVNGAANVTVAAGAILALAPGCYRDVRVNSGGTLNLSAGAYTFRTLRLIAGSTLNGAGQTVNVQSDTNSEGGVKINDVTIETPGSVGFSVTTFISIGNNNTLNSVVLYAPTSGIHLHTGLQATNLEAVANFITIEPKNNPPDQGLVCKCPTGTKFEVNPLLGTSDPLKVRNCVACQPGEVCP